MISLAKSPHLLQQQLRGFISEQADVTKGQREMLEAALSKVCDRVNHLVGLPVITWWRSPRVPTYPSIDSIQCPPD